MTSITFLGEQDGAAEQQLKRRLATYLASERGIREAYLVRVAYPDTEEHKVSLCLRGADISESEVVTSVGEVFKRLFKTTESLDVIFLKDEQVLKVVAVAKPFYAGD